MVMWCIRCSVVLCGIFFFQAEDGIRDYKVTGVQTCALPISVYGGRWCDSRCFPCCLIGCVCEIRLVSRIIRDWVRTRPTKSRIDAIETFAWRCLYVPPQAHVERDFAGSAEIIKVTFNMGLRWDVQTSPSER